MLDAKQTKDATALHLAVGTGKSDLVWVPPPCQQGRGGGEGRGRRGREGGGHAGGGGEGRSGAGGGQEGSPTTSWVPDCPL